MAAELPNIRKLFVPDPGFAIFDCDLKGADAQVVAWEAEDEDLKRAFRSGVDIHSKNAEDLFGLRFTQLTGAARAQFRTKCKSAVHGTNYVGSPKGIAKNIGWTVHEVDQLQKRWFHEHPRIKKWHERLEAQLARNRTITNVFGFRRIYFERVEGLLPQAAAWVGQSTTAITCSTAMVQVEERTPWVQLLLQVHDSLVGQLPLSYINPHRLSELRSALRVIAPYPDPLEIPWELKISKTSWGDGEKTPWPTKEKAA